MKKGPKNKQKDIPPALQNQWEKDQQKKAARKEQRQLERLFAELNPHMTSIRQVKIKKGKGKNKIRDASLAHLLPGSAREAADLFDVSSDEEDDHPGRMGGMRVLLLPKTLADIESEIRLFLEQEDRTTMSLPPMDKEGRMKVHMLAECFGLKSKSRGSGKSRFS